MVRFPVLSVVVSAWLTILNLRGRLASVGFAQARPNKAITICAGKDAGFPDLKDKQKEAIKAFLKGNDKFVSLPTGYGKSVTYAVC